jgi:hypothetical protein
MIACAEDMASCPSIIRSHDRAGVLPYIRHVGGRRGTAESPRGSVAAGVSTRAAADSPLDADCARRSWSGSLPHPRGRRETSGGSTGAAPTARGSHSRRVRVRRDAQGRMSEQERRQAVDRSRTPGGAPLPDHMSLEVQKDTPVSGDLRHRSWEVETDSGTSSDPGHRSLSQKIPRIHVTPV